MNEGTAARGDRLVSGRRRRVRPSPDARARGARRAERSGGWRGRQYVLVYEAEDASGNVATRTVTVGVPHDLRIPRPRLPR